MVVTLEEMKQYLRVDYEDDDQLITGFIASAEQLCRDVLRVDETADLEKDETVKIAVMYAAAYFYEHRVPPALEVVMGQDRAAHDGQVGVGAHEVVGELAHEVQ